VPSFATIVAVLTVETKVMVVALVVVALENIVVVNGFAVIEETNDWSEFTSAEVV
jgi:hypothetical protein